jgi:hypothetical protein
VELEDIRMRVERIIVKWYATRSEANWIVPLLIITDGRGNVYPCLEFNVVDGPPNQATAQSLEIAEMVVWPMEVVEGHEKHYHAASGFEIVRIEHAALEKVKLEIRGKQCYSLAIYRKGRGCCPATTVAVIYTTLPPDERKRRLPDDEIVRALFVFNRYGHMLLSTELERIVNDAVEMPQVEYQRVVMTIGDGLVLAIKVRGTGTRDANELSDPEPGTSSAQRA